MTVHLAAGGTIELQGECPLEDAEKLQQYLIADPGAAVDWRACASAHTAVLQVLLAAKPALRGPPASGFLQKHLEALVKAPRDISTKGSPV
jgi:hypothetical protein